MVSVSFQLTTAQHAASVFVGLLRLLHLVLPFKLACQVRVDFFPVSTSVKTTTLHCGLFNIYVSYAMHETGSTLHARSFACVILEKSPL